jgi:diaminohydroxyphosphoribosylaminopyrimidine deaminase/5-amino-6-(5-phosphoribosylamino)uracil reductase
VLDSSLRLLPSTTLVRSARDVPTLILTTRRAPVHARRMLASFGVEVIGVDADGAGQVDLQAALRALAERGVTRLCCEGGPHLADALAGADLVDVFTLITGPGSLGESGGLPAIGPVLRERLDDGHLEPVETRILGPDRAVTYERSA